MLRLFLVAIAATGLVRGDTAQELVDLFASMASALSEDNPGVFLRAIDPSMPGYERFAANIYALTAQNGLSNSVEIISHKGDDGTQAVALDWLLDISGKGQSQLFVRREMTVKCRLERRKKKAPRRRNLWVIWAGSARRLAEEAVEFAAGGIEGAL